MLGTLHRGVICLLVTIIALQSTNAPQENGPEVVVNGLRNRLSGGLWHVEAGAIIARGRATRGRDFEVCLDDAELSDSIPKLISEIADNNSICSPVKVKVSGNKLYGSNSCRVMFTRYDRSFSGKFSNTQLDVRVRTTVSGGESDSSSSATVSQSIKANRISECKPK